MEDLRDKRHHELSPTYSASQVEAVISYLGIEVVGETMNDFLALCAFHDNRNTPSFSVSKTSGKYLCFSGSCYESGTLMQLVQKLSARTFFEAARFIQKHGTNDVAGDQVLEAMKPNEEWVEFSQDILDRMYDNFWECAEAIDYMTEARGFTEETLRSFRVGYDRGYVTVPMHNPDGMPVGVIGRPPSKINKKFKNSKKLPVSKTLWNMNRAKREGDTVIICESSFDAMRITQAGYPNVVACLGGNFSDFHASQINRHFSTVVIMTDFDDRTKHMYDGCRKCAREGINLCKGHNPGRDLGSKIATTLSRKNILWTMHNDKLVYPHKAKDAGDLTDDEIRHCLVNAVGSFTYSQCNPY